MAIFLGKMILLLDLGWSDPGFWYLNNDRFNDHHTILYSGSDLGTTTSVAYTYDHQSHQYLAYKLSRHDVSLGINVSTEAGIINNWLQGPFAGFTTNLEYEIDQLNIQKAKWDSFHEPYTISYSSSNIFSNNEDFTYTYSVDPESDNIDVTFIKYTPSVSSLFLQLKNSLKEWGPKYKVSYSEEYGFPISIQKRSRDYSIYSYDKSCSTITYFCIY